MSPTQRSLKVHYALTQYGFEYGAVKIDRLCSDEKKGWVAIGVATKKHERIQIYVTKTGKVRISDERGEWKAPK